VSGNLTWKYLCGLSRAESLYPMSNICDRTVIFPAQAVIQCQVRPNLPTILSKEISTGRPHILMLRRTLLVNVGKSEKVIRVQIVRNNVILADTAVSVKTIYFEVQCLVKTLATHIGAELKSVVSANLG